MTGHWDARREKIALDLILQAETMGDAETANRSHLVKVHDPETGDDSFWGPYATAFSALKAAVRIVAGLNDGIGDDAPSRASVHYIAPPHAPSG